VLRLLPPLTLGDDEAEHLLGVLDRALDAVAEDRDTPRVRAEVTRV
jgi:acetylornithine/succinyldiaminopimelate/putrescine aminotransferase